MSRLAIQISVAAVFLTNVVAATSTNPQCSSATHECPDKSKSVCVQTLDYMNKTLNICFDKPTPSEENGNNKAVAQAFLASCYESNIDNECSKCCKKSVPGRSCYGELTTRWSYNFCLCKLLN